MDSHEELVRHLKSTVHTWSMAELLMAEQQSAGRKQYEDYHAIYTEEINIRRKEYGSEK